jgi:diguanylate cyclase (GGDEF)-like protein
MNQLVKLKMKPDQMQMRRSSSASLEVDRSWSPPNKGYREQIGKIKDLLQSTLVQDHQLLPSALDQLKTIFQEIEKLEKNVELSFSQHLIYKSKRPLSRQTLQYLAFYDSLTHLPNREYFRAAVEELLEEPGHTCLYLAFLDLDGFKQVNDVYGHEMGDWLLEQVAQRLQECLRKSDLICRYGGDEFVFLFQDCETLELLRGIINRVLEVIKQPFHRGQFSLFISASMGVATFDNQESTFDDLLQQADEAMYQAKMNGKNGCFFSNKANASSLSLISSNSRII